VREDAARSRAPLRRALLVPTAALAAVAAAVLAAIALEWVLQARRLGREVAQVRATNAIVLELNHRQADMHRALLSFRYRGDAAARADLEAREGELAAAVAAASALDLPPRGRALRDEYVAARAAQLAAEHGLLAAAGAEREVYRLALDRWDLVTERASALLADLSVWDVKRLDRAVASAEARRGGALAGFALTVLAAVAALAARVDRRIVRPLLWPSATSSCPSRRTS